MEPVIPFKFYSIHEATAASAKTQILDLEWSLQCYVSNKFLDATNAAMCSELSQGVNDSSWSHQEKSKFQATVEKINGHHIFT